MANTILFGFLSLASGDFLNQRAIMVPEVKAAIDVSVEQHNAMIGNVMGVFADSTTNYTRRFESNATGVLQPLDEYGRSRPMKTSTYSLGFPIKMAGAATGYTFVAREKATVIQVNNKLSQMLMADVRWMQRQILGAMFDNTAGGVAFDDPQWGAITTYGLANGDASPKYYIANSDSEAADNHYYAQSSAISDAANPFQINIYDELMEHPENGGAVVTLISNSLKASVMGLADFVHISNAVLIPGSGTDTISGFPTDALPAGALPLGYLKDSKVFIAEWRRIPSNYMISYTSEGDKPLAFREDPEPSLQGFRAADELNEFPYYGTQWFRRGGFAANNRVGAVVSYIGVSGTYAVPSGYGLLMAT